MIRIVSLCIWIAAMCPLAGFTALNVRDFGAAGDGIAKDTAAIQKAIDTAERQGGGTVLVPAGRYLSGTLHLKSNVTLWLDNGSTILARTDNADFDPYEKLGFASVSDNETTYFRYGLVTAENAHHIAILGQGTIDGNRTRRRGPKTVAIKLCRHVTIRGITVANSPNYSISFWGTDYIDIDGVTILNGYADGIDPDASRFVRISNCFIDCYDDAICPKASPSMGIENRRGTEHLVVTNCTTRTNCSNFKFGTESSGDFRDIALSNITMLPRETGRRPVSGISLESVDGAHINGIVISNITMTGISTPMFVRLGNRGRGLNPPAPGSIENVSFDNIVIRGAAMPSHITGIPGYPVRHVSLARVLIASEGRDREARGLEVPERIQDYPEASMFGILPAYAFYARHVENLTLSNVEARWSNEDFRPAMVFDDVRGLGIDGFSAAAAAGSSAVLWMNSVRDALVRGARTGPAPVFLKVTGASSRGIVLDGNDLSKAGRALDRIGPPRPAVRLR